MRKSISHRETQLQTIRAPAADLSECLTLKTDRPSGREDAERPGLPCIAVRMRDGTNTLQNNLQLLKTLTTYLSHVPAIVPLAIYPREMKACVFTKTGMRTEVLFVRAKNWEKKENTISVTG